MKKLALLLAATFTFMAVMAPEAIAEQADNPSHRIQCDAYPGKPYQVYNAGGNPPNFYIKGPSICDCTGVPDIEYCESKLFKLGADGNYYPTGVAAWDNHPAKRIMLWASKLPCERGWYMTRGYFEGYHDNWFTDFAWSSKVYIKCQL